MNTKPVISSMTLGTAQLGVHYGIANTMGQPSMREAHDIVRAAIEGGINSFDTAASYGNSEDILGEFFCSRTAPVIITKIGLNINTDPREIRNKIREEAAASSKRLKINPIPVLMLHNLLLPESYFGAVLDGFRDCCSDGVAAFFGISCGADSESLRKLIRIADDPVISYVQLPVNVADQRPLLYDVLSRMHAKGIRVFARSVYLQGLLLLPEKDIPDDLREIVPLIRKLSLLSAETGWSVQQLAVAYVRDMPGVHSLVIGAETAGQVESNVSLMNGPELDPLLRATMIEEAGSLSEYVLNPALWAHQAVFK